MKNEQGKSNEGESDTGKAQPKASRWGVWQGRMQRGFSHLQTLTVRGLRGSATLMQRGWNHGRVLRLRAWLASSWRALMVSAGHALPGFKRRARRVLLVFGAAGLVALFTLFLGRFTLQTIQPGQIGVRYSKWDGDGVSMQDFGPGLHLSIPGVHKWHTLPASTELLSWRTDEQETDKAALDVRTLDGTSVQLGLTIPYAVMEESAHRIVAIGYRNTFRLQARARAEQVLLDEFARLRSEQFSRADVLAPVLERALVRMNSSLAEIHLEAESILLDTVVFSAAYEKKLVETQREHQRGRVLVARQLEDQEQQTILRRRHEIDAELLERRIQFDREIEELRANGQEQAALAARSAVKLEGHLRADADRDFDTLVAGGEASLARAKALEKRLRGEILAGPGGDEFLAWQTARGARFTEVFVNANDPRMPNLLDVTGMATLFGLKTAE